MLESTARALKGLRKGEEAVVLVLSWAHRKKPV